MTAVTHEPALISQDRPKRLNRGTFLMVGVVLAPIVIAFVVFPGGALTEESALRMAFAAVAGKTLATLSAAAALVITLRRDRRVLPVLFFATVFVLVFAWAIASMTSTGELLLTRLELVADTARLSG